MAEIVDDIVCEVRTPTPPLPNLEDLEICKEQFELKNKKYNLYYNELVMKWFRKLESDLYEHHKMNPEQQYWDLDVDYFNALIQDIEDDEFDKPFFKGRYDSYFELSKKKPIERSSMYGYLSGFVNNLVESVPQIGDDIRKEQDLWDSTFKIPGEEDPTEEEIKQKKDEFDKLIAEWVKKTKKKKAPTEEEIQQLKDKHTVDLTEGLKQYISNYFEKFDEQQDYIKVLYDLQNKEVPDISYFELLQRKISLKDMEIDGKRIMIKVHLKIKEDEVSLQKKIQHEENILNAKELEIKRLEEQKALEEKLKQEKKKGKRPAKKDKNQQEEQDLQPKQTIDVSFLDEENLKQIIDLAVNCLEHQAKLVILLVSYDQKLGEQKMTSSLKFLYEFIKEKLVNQNSAITFSEDCFVQGFDEKVEAEQFGPDNSLLILENCYFRPEEISFKKQLKVFQPDEIGFREEDKEEEIMCKLYNEDKNEYIQTLSNYATNFCIEDKYNFFDNLTSINQLTSDNIVAGPAIFNDLTLTGYSFGSEKNPSLVLLGGTANPDKYLAINTMLAYMDQIILTGQIGIQFYLVKNDLESIGQFKVQELEKNIIKYLLNKDSSQRLIITEDFIISEDFESEEIEKGSKEYYTTLKEKQIAFPIKKETQQSQQEIQEEENKEKEVVEEEKLPFPENHIILEYGVEFLNLIEQYIIPARKLIWIDNLQILDKPHTNAINEIVVKQLYRIKDEKKTRCQQAQNNNILNYDYKEDCMIFIVGKEILQMLNFINISQEDTKVSKQGSEAELKEDQEKTPEEEEKETEQDQKKEDTQSLVSGMAKQRNVLEDVKDFYSPDSLFNLKLMQGKWVDAITRIHHYSKKSVDLLEGELSFLDNGFADE